MKKFTIGLLFGSGAIYLTLFFQPTWLITNGDCSSSDSTTIQVDSLKANADTTVELSPAFGSSDSAAKKDSTKK